MQLNRVKLINISRDICHNDVAFPKSLIIKSRLLNYHPGLCKDCCTISHGVIKLN
jgi:hypothetical protein